MIIMSDTHVSCPDGRWANATPHFRAFLRTLKSDPPEILFINGDIIDNIVIKDGKPFLGKFEHWQKDVRTYLKAIEPYGDITFRGSLGPGHDFYEATGLTKEQAAEHLCSHRGSFSWQGFNFVWISGNIHSFSNDPERREESFGEEDLIWLDQELTGLENIVLLFHVPVATTETVKHGAWPGNRSIVIPPEDAIYPVIDRHLERIRCIFNGHMHGHIESDYKGVPVHIATFYGLGHYYEVSVQNGSLNVVAGNCPQRGEKSKYDRR